MQQTNFLLSKYTAIAQYIVLNHKKIIKDKELDLYCKKSGKLGVHPKLLQWNFALLALWAMDFQLQVVFH